MINIIERGASEFHTVVTVIVANNLEGFHTGVGDPNVVIGAMKVTIPIKAKAVR